MEVPNTRVVGHLLTQDGVPALLDGLTVIANGGTELPIKICAKHLALLGASWEPENPSSERDGIDPLLVGELALRPASLPQDASSTDDGVDCIIRWQCPNRREPKLPGAEVMVQALSGLMEVHGRDRRRPRRLGLDVASVAAGIVAAQGVLAALIARSRGQRIRGVETSVFQAGLLFLYHHLAMATCSDEFPLCSPGSAPGPPFHTADGYWVELEVLTFEAWRAFWRQLGVDRAELEEAWEIFMFRYLTARCPLPATLHEATGRHTLAELRSAADACGVAICHVRTYPELLAELGWSEEAERRGTSFELRLGTPWTIRPGTRRGPDLHRHFLADAPLAGLRVIEVTSRLQGPLAGLLLRMLGADVLKVEPPGGDIGRVAPAGALRAAYLAYNRGKRVVEIDYKRPEGRAELADLVAKADVFLHNWRPGRAERLGFDFEDLARGNPGLVYAHASGWGRTGDGPGPIAGDYIVQADAGCGDGLNPPDEPPFPSRLTLVDITGGLLACEGILAGLYLRERTGQGCRVDTSLLAGAMVLQAHILEAITTEQEAGRRMGRPLWGLLDQPVETANGFLVVAAEDKQARKRLSKVCGLRAFEDEGSLDELIAERLRSRSAAEWEQLLLDAGIPAAAVHSDLASLPNDPHVTSLLENVDDTCWVPAAPWKFKT
jgi:crotonobetainyl-CoA:carnitine CoA-transferase CaiB-like acyl-CoA transferase